MPGVPKGKVTIIGGGVVGTHAARIALGLGAQVTILDISAKRLSVLEESLVAKIQTLMSNPLNIEASVRDADVVIGAVLIPGAKAPKLVTDHMVKQMRPGSVIVDVAVDQGGVVETADRVTTHDEPVYETHGVLHYAVANIPGAVHVHQPLPLPMSLYLISKPLQEKDSEKPLTTTKVFVKGLQPTKVISLANQLQRV